MMLYAVIVVLPVVFAVLILFAMGVVLTVGRLDALRQKRNAAKAVDAQVADEMAWVDTVDRIVGIPELLKGKSSG